MWKDIFTFAGLEIVENICSRVETHNLLFVRAQSFFLCNFSFSINSSQSRFIRNCYNHIFTLVLSRLYRSQEHLVKRNGYPNISLSEERKRSLCRSYHRKMRSCNESMHYDAWNVLTIWSLWWYAVCSLAIETDFWDIQNVS